MCSMCIPCFWDAFNTLARKGTRSFAFVPAYQMVIISPAVARMRSCILESTLKSSLSITLQLAASSRSHAPPLFRRAATLAKKFARGENHGTYSTARHQQRDVLDRPARARVCSGARGDHRQRSAGAADAQERARATERPIAFSRATAGAIPAREAPRGRTRPRAPRRPSGGGGGCGGRRGGERPRARPCPTRLHRLWALYEARLAAYHLSTYT